MHPQFARDQVSDLDLDERLVQSLIQALVTDPSSGWTNEVDLQVLLFRLTIDSACEFLFGKSVNSQLAALNSVPVSGSDEQTFAFAFDQDQKLLATHARLQTLYCFYQPPIFHNCCRSCHGFIDQFVRLTLSEKLRDKEVERGSGDKEKYIFLEALALRTRDPIELRSQLLHILPAGRDTTASLLGWLFYSLARDTAWYQKLRSVVLEEFGTYDKPSEITFARPKSCTYLQHCMHDSLRLFPEVPVNSRTANKGTTIPRGGGLDGNSKIFVPEGTQVDYSVRVMHRRQDIKGPDAEEFVPERWEGRKVGWEYLPFNGGPRIGNGEQFAFTEASYVTGRLLQRVSMMKNRDFEPVQHNLTLTNCSGRGVKLRE